MKCETINCNNIALVYRKLCATCRTKEYKEKHPINYFYLQLKKSAKRRNKIFTLTLREFKLFCEKTNCLNKRGKHTGDFTIDRIDPDKGYSLNNIRLITVSENIKRHFNNEIPIEFIPPDIIECPF